MEIRAIRAEEIEEARSLLIEEPGWAARFKDAAKFREEVCITKSQRALVAIDERRIVGFNARLPTEHIERLPHAPNRPARASW